MPLRRLAGAAPLHGSCCSGGLQVLLPVMSPASEEGYWAAPLYASFYNGWLLEPLLFMSPAPEECYWAAPLLVSCYFGKLLELLLFLVLFLSLSKAAGLSPFFDLSYLSLRRAFETAPLPVSCPWTELLGGAPLNRRVIILPSLLFSYNDLDVFLGLLFCSSHHPGPLPAAVACWAFGICPFREEYCEDGAL